MSIHLHGPVTYWQPDPALADLVSGYVRYDIAVPPGHVMRDAFFPSRATIRVQIDGPDWSLKLGPRHYAPMPRVAFIGPTSFAGYLESAGGTLVSIGVRPAGWAQFFGGDISRYANRVIPLAQLDAGAARLAEAPQETEHPQAALNAWLLARAGRGTPVDPRVATLQTLLADERPTRIMAVAEQLDMTPRALAALTRFHFGFTPKILVRRSRFMRALTAVLTSEGDAAQQLTEAGYWDRSHFLRDCHLFLGSSLRDFNKRRGVHNQLAMRERELVLGAAI